MRVISWIVTDFRIIFALCTTENRALASGIRFRLARNVGNWVASFPLSPPPTAQMPAAVGLYCGICHCF
jgi:hypothetical protein